MEVRNQPEVDVPDLKDILPKSRPDQSGVQVSADENGPVATMWMDPKPFDPMRVGDVNRHVTARFDANGNLQLSTKLSGGCLPQTTPGAKAVDIIALRKALLEKLTTMDQASPEAAQIQRLCDALRDRLLSPAGFDDFDKIERPEHPAPPKMVDW